MKFSNSFLLKLAASTGTPLPAYLTNAQPSAAPAANTASNIRQNYIKLPWEEMKSESFYNHQSEGNGSPGNKPRTPYHEKKINTSASAAGESSASPKFNNFGEAFKHYRKDLGAGKTFEYNGASYSTNIAGESGKTGPSSKKQKMTGNAPMLDPVYAKVDPNVKPYSGDETQKTVSSNIKNIQNAYTGMTSQIAKTVNKASSRNYAQSQTLPAYGVGGGNLRMENLPTMKKSAPASQTIVKSDNTQGKTTTFSEDALNFYKKVKKTPVVGQIAAMAESAPALLAGPAAPFIIGANHVKTFIDQVK